MLAVLEDRSSTARWRRARSWGSLVALMAIKLLLDQIAPEKQEAQ